MYAVTESINFGFYITNTKIPLQVEICRTAGQFPQERFADTLSESSSDSSQSREEDEVQNTAVTVRVSVCFEMTVSP